MQYNYIYYNTSATNYNNDMNFILLYRTRKNEDCDKSIVIPSNYIISTCIFMRHFINLFNIDIHIPYAVYIVLSMQYMQRYIYSVYMV